MVVFYLGHMVTTKGCNVQFVQIVLIERLRKPEVAALYEEDKV